MKTFFFKKIYFRKIKQKFFFKKQKFSFYKKNKSIKKVNKIKKYNFTKVWFIKYNNFILATVFVYFFFKVKGPKIKLKKKAVLQKSPLVFWKKKRGHNIKKKLFLGINHLVF